MYACLHDPDFFKAVPEFADLADIAADTITYATNLGVSPRQVLWGCIVALYKKMHDLPRNVWEPKLTAYIQARTGNKPIKLDIPGLFS